ncbi:type III-B CRISPR module-associated Cmr3 family protein [Saccharolobus islandicus]|uniref:CRISPR-associated protein, Cmr3 n=1 Tax=Saccharolobus islandicus LAL14/1 TaxID=1241935 RepID=M9U830_SACIS|nr:type III-B CRISPR module-associated Cmr3 family protein [Sulfolobus islandicus]AGJ62243.1 CRISPR-associated protein, Cmr3 [Sulfolobus islandicus LAL14/1]
MYLLIKPLGSVVFKWGGYNSILLGGAINSGYFEPLPMPSTIYGLLKYAYIVTKLGNEAPKFKGPLLYAKSKKKQAICVHAYPLGLKCNIEGEEKDIKVEEEDFERRIGIAINRETKMTKEGYIYMEKMLDLYKLSKRILNENGETFKEEPEKYGILIETDDENAKKLDGLVAPFGGESRPAKISVEEISFKKIGKKLLASPAIIDNGDDNHVEWGNQKASISAKKIIYRLISLGFEFDKRLEIRLSLMPTVEVSKDSIGYFTDKGWGSVVEI